jgi:hypothetical protein
MGDGKYIENFTKELGRLLSRWENKTKMDVRDIHFGISGVERSDSATGE